MRHAVLGRKLARTSSHRLALRRNLVQNLIEHGSLRTTVVKAKEVRRLAERLVTIAIRGQLAEKKASSRQLAEAILTDRAIIPKEKRADYDKMTDAKRARVLRSRSGRRYRKTTARPGVAFTAASVVAKLFNEIAPAMVRRNQKLNSKGGGYTRIIKLPDRRVGDGSPLAILQFVGENDKPRVKGSDKSPRKQRIKKKYAFYAGKPMPRRGRRGEKGAPAATSAAAQSGTGAAPAADSPADST
ncbi:MAG: 50S ribosomal protein L17 [Phycisphaerae bacterium]